MRLDELSKEAQRGSGILVLRQQTATLTEREALSTLIADITERVAKANNEGYRKGMAQGREKVAAIERVAAQVDENQRALNEQNATAHRLAERIERLESQVRI